MKMMKRILAILLTATLTLSPGITGLQNNETALAAEVDSIGAAVLEEGDFKYTELPNGTLKITKYTGNSTQVEIPSSIGGKTVVMIGDKTFSGCNDLTSIKIPAGITNIGEASTASSSSAEFPVFDECSSLTEFIVDSGSECYSSAEGILYNKEKTELLICPAGKSGNASIADGVINVKGQAFYHCSSLTSITIPASVGSIMGIDMGSSVYGNVNSAFGDCSSLTEIIVDNDNATYCSQDGILYGKTTSMFPSSSSESQLNCLLCYPPGKQQGIITIPDGISRIGTFAFYNCNSLTRIEIPASISSIDSYSIYSSSYTEFYNCRNLTDIIVDENNTIYASDNGVLYTKDMTTLMCCPAGKDGNIEIPETVTEIGIGAFDSCNRLTNIAIGKNVQAINKGYSNICMAFRECMSLESITVANSNQTYSSVDGLLYNKDMSQLICCPPGKKNSVSIPDGVTIINNYSFYNCANLKKIVIPKSVERIAPEYDSCGDAFRNCKNLSEIIVNDDNERYSSMEGIIYFGNYLHICPEGKEGSITIPEGTRCIYYDAFKNCDKLSSIQFPESLDTIESNAFAGCTNIKKMELPECINSIHRGTFQNCTQLSSIYIPESVTSIADDAFDGCKNDLRIVCIENSFAKTYAIENGIQYELTESRKKPQVISASDLTKTVGDVPFLLNVSTDGDGVLTYKSSNESVAGITEEGIIVINGAGTAQITITASETDLYKAAQKTITITVNDGSGSEISPIIGTRYDIGDCTYVISSTSPKEVSLISFNKDTLTEDENHASAGYSLRIPATVVINGMAFEVTAIAPNACHNSTILTSIEIGPNVNMIGRAAFGGCTNLNEITVSENHKTFSSYDGCLYNKDFSQLLCCPAGKTTAKLKEGTASIKSDAFGGCEGLTSIEIPESVTGIETDEDGTGGNIFESCTGLTIHCTADSWICQYAAENSIQTSAKKLQSVTASDFTKTVGDMPFFIQAKTDGDGVLTYKSSNDSVASVSEEGIIIIKGAGTAQITITASETDAYTASETVITVTVNPKPGSGTNDSGQTTGNGQNTGNAETPENNSATESIQKTQSAKVKIKSAKSKKSKSLTLKLSGLSNCDGYQIQYGLKKNFKGAKSITKKTSSVTVKKLKAKKTYYVRVRVYKKIAGSTYYGKWSNKKSVKIKK